jgi:predicted esterase
MDMTKRSRPGRGLFMNGAMASLVALLLVACGGNADTNAGTSAGVTTGSTGGGGGGTGGGSTASGTGGTGGGSTTSSTGGTGGGSTASGTGGTGGSTTSGTGGGGGSAPAIAFPCPGGTVGPDKNTLTVAGAERVFYADFPKDTSQPMGILFSWHGFGQPAADFRAASALDPNANPSLPVVVITPDDSGLQPPVGLDWDIAKGTAGDKNVDIAFFEAMVGCLNEQYDIDSTRIYSYGFSAGSVMTSLLHSRYPRLLSAIIAVSGAWFNDQAEEDLVNLIKIDWNWPPLDPADGGAVLLTHGGPKDVTVLNLLDLEASAQAAFPFLGANGRVVVDCAHTQGHTPHPKVTPAVISKFISEHRAGEPSPYLNGGYGGFPDTCVLRLP